MRMKNKCSNCQPERPEIATCVASVSIIISHFYPNILFTNTSESRPSRAEMQFSICPFKRDESSFETGKCIKIMIPCMPCVFFLSFACIAQCSHFMCAIQLHWTNRQTNQQTNKHRIQQIWERERESRQKTSLNTSQQQKVTNDNKAQKLENIA